MTQVSLSQSQIETIVLESIQEAASALAHSLDVEHVSKAVHSFMSSEGERLIQQITGSTMRRHTQNTRTTDTVESLSKEVQTLNDARLALSLRTATILIPMADNLLARGKIDELGTFLASFPECPTRMKIAGKIAKARWESLHSASRKGASYDG
jgi:uncharacterized protein with von Willebrand factor type A (vWA) domain